MTTYVFTSVSSNYLPKARMLATSVKRHTPRARFCLLLAERGREGIGDVSMPEIDEVVGLDDLGIPDLERWAFGHTLVELCTAVKGALLSRLLDRPDCNEVFYFDPDIVLFTPLATLSERFRGGSVLLTPHLTEPDLTEEAIRDNEMCALRHGVYNLGFLGVRNDEAGRQFAGWWWDRLSRFCRDDIPSGLFTDQRWVDLAPGMFDGVVIVRDPAWNVATWNLGRRYVEGRAPDDLRVNGSPLRFYHFSGLDSGAQLAMLRKYATSMPALFDLRSWYRDGCEALARRLPPPGGWQLDFFDDGEPIQTWQRRLYAARADLQAAFPEPFATDDVGRSYQAWCEANVGPCPDGTGEDAAVVAARYRAELDDIYSSRAWKLAVATRRLASLGRRLIATGSRWRSVVAKREEG